MIPQSELGKTYVQPGMYVTPETFERHLRFLTAHFELLSMRDLLIRWDGKTWDSTACYCALTFDDGWLDNLLYAYPLLRAYHVPVTIFLPTDLIGTSEWFWPDRLGYLLHQFRSPADFSTLRETLEPLFRRFPQLIVVDGLNAPDPFDLLTDLVKTIPEEARSELLERLATTAGVRTPDERRLLNWDEVRDMSAHDVAFGSHTCTHASLSRLDGEYLRHELRRPFPIFREQNVDLVPVLSYPYGDYTAAVVAETQAAGYHAAVTGDGGLEGTTSPDLFRLKRIGVHDNVSRSVQLFAFHIARHAGPSRDTRCQSFC